LKWAIIAIALLIIFYLSAESVWSTIIFTNLTSFDVFMADGYMILAPLLIVGAVFIFVRMRLKREGQRHKLWPFSHEELQSQFNNMAIASQEIFYQSFLSERFGVGKEELFSGLYDEHLKQIADFDAKQREAGEPFPLHPSIINELEQQIHRSRT